MAEIDVAVVAGAEIDIDLDGDNGDVKHVGHPGGGRDRRPVYSDFSSSGIQGSVAGTPILVNFGGPASGRIWDIRQLVSFGQDDRTQGQQASQTAAGTAANNLVLPAGQALSNVTLTMAGVAAPVSGTLTISGGVGGTLTYQVTDGTNGVIMPITFTQPLMPATPGGSITVALSAIAGGGASGLVATTLLPIAWYKSTSDPNPNNLPMLTNLLVPGVRFVPDTVVPGSAESLFVKFREILVAVVYGVPVGNQVGGVVRVADWADTVPEARYVR